MKICYTKNELQKEVNKLKSDGKKIGFVPTMGALHEGHISLVTYAKLLSDIVVCSIFVNPQQFAEGEDLETYPRPKQQDIDILIKNDVDILYLPSVIEIYPENEDIIDPPLQNNTILEGEFRPHFLRGVGIVVTKLFNHIQPDIAVFGQKDYQQLQYIKFLVSELKLDIDIISAPIIRENDGLALSSRNRYLSIEHRKNATNIYRIINEISINCNNVNEINKLTNWGKEELIKSGFDSVDYIKIRDADNLANPPTEKAILLVAATIGGTRLIDNKKIVILSEAH